MKGVKMESEFIYKIKGIKAMEILGKHYPVCTVVEQDISGKDSNEAIQKAKQSGMIAIIQINNICEIHGGEIFLKKDE
jgi:hypothetical protein